MDAAAPPADPAGSAPPAKVDKADAIVNENKFQQAIAAWRNVNLAELMPALDSAAEELVEHQRDSVTQRKELAQKTKDFRKLDDQSKLSEIKGLLKSYQNFIDVLTNQSKSISAAFFKAYTPLSEAPDPYPLLEASVESIVTAEETVPKLAEDNQRLQQTVSQLTNQLETTEKKLEEEFGARKDLEETRDAKIKEVETSYSAVLTEKQDNWEAKERSLEEKVESQERLLKELKASYEVSQRLGKGEDDEDSRGHSGATAAELEIVSSELDRANTRLAEIEARNEQLRLELAQSASSTNTQASAPVEDDPLFKRLQSENQSLLRKLDTARYEKESERRDLEAEVRKLEKELASLKQERDALREKVNSWADYENVKRELEVLKSIEFAMGEDDDGDVAADAGAEGATGAQSKEETLEQLLLARNKKLSDELTVLRVSHQDLQTRLEQLQEELSNTNMELEKSQNLAQTLENDLMKVQQEASNAFDSSAMSVAGTYTSRYPQSSFAGRKGGRTSPTSSIISGFNPRDGSPNTLDALRSGESVGGGSGILPMVTAQRDRFKKKNAELEAELQKAHQNVSSLRSEIASLQKDNLSLYEKTRYVSTYNRGHASAYSSGTNPSTVQVTSDSSNLDRYRSAYEQNISPFAAFRGRETARAFKRMSLPERFVFRVTKTVLATRTSRNMFAAYCMALHLLVFWMLLSGTSGPVDETISLSNSGSAAAAAAAAAAGAAGRGPLAGGDAHDGGNWQPEGFHDT